MKQVIQNYKTGELKVEEVPCPIVRRNGVLVKTAASLISAGTERTKIETAQMNMIEKAISRLDLVKIVMNNIKQEGLVFTLKKAFNKLDTPITMGYSCSGIIIEAGRDVKGFMPGDRVACVGEGFATHGEINSVPEEFVVKLSENIDMEEASFVGLGAISLNAVVTSQLDKNDTVVVIGLGLLGQLVTQTVKSIGCGVIGVDIDDDKIKLARDTGCEASVNILKQDLHTLVKDFTGGRGADAVIITAASSNNLPIKLAGEIVRDKGRVILVGAMPIIIPRKEYYEKELFFVISRGFGAGMYYRTEKERWYPYNYKPVTVKENMENFLKLLADKKINVKPLITHRFSLSETATAYELIRTNKEKYVGIIFEYGGKPATEKNIYLHKEKLKDKINVGFIGAGSFAQGYLLPVLKKTKGVSLCGVATASGVNAKNVARKFGFGYSTTDYNEILNDKNINCVFIITRHNLHAGMVIEGLKKNKNIFVEKPLCLNENELRGIVNVYQSAVGDNGLPVLMVGFNRRFSPFITATKNFFENRVAPLILNYRVNAGCLPPEHWVHNPDEGGGRIIGELCHFVDLFQFLTGSHPAEVSAITLNHPDKGMPDEDNVLVTIKFKDGSIGTINYNSVGDLSFPRERLEVFGCNSVAVVDNFRTAVFSRAGVVKKIHRLSRDMGHNSEVKLFINGLLKKEISLIPFDEIIHTTLATFKIVESLKQKTVAKIDIKKWTE